MKFNEAIEKYIEEGSKDIIYVTRRYGYDTLWISSGPCTGITTVFNDTKTLEKTFLTNKKGDDHFDSIVYNIAKAYPTGKAIEVPVYEQCEDPFDKSKKPIDKIYMTITNDKYIVIGFYNNKKEAQMWAKNRW